MGTSSCKGVPIRISNDRSHLVRQVTVILAALLSQGFPFLFLLIPFLSCSCEHFFQGFLSGFSRFLQTRWNLLYSVKDGSAVTPAGFCFHHLCFLTGLLSLAWTSNVQPVVYGNQIFKAMDMNNLWTGVVNILLTGILDLKVRNSKESGKNC